MRHLFGLGRRGLARDVRGAAAVEFALVVPVLLAIILSTLEVGWIMVQSIMLDRALDLTVRELRIGSFVDPTQAKMRDMVCDRAQILINCKATLALELIPILTAASYPTDSARCVDRSSPIAPVLRFNAGARTQTVFVRACFVVEPITPMIGLSSVLSLDASGAMRLVSTSGFVNEPS